jgi:Putative Actinobacterial Holin-X, holin superfamily III
VIAVTDVREPQHPGDHTVGTLVHDLTQQTSQLIREEMALARAELQEKGRHAGLGIGLFSGAGLLAFFGGACLVATAVLALALAMPSWLAGLIVTLVLFAAAGVAALVGKKQVQRSTPPKPEQTIDNLPRDVRAVTQPIKERNHT